MKCNIGSVEKTVRLLLALPISAIGILLVRQENYWGLGLIGIGLWLLFTALMRWCPVRRVLKPTQPAEGA